MVGADGIEYSVFNATQSIPCALFTWNWNKRESLFCEVERFSEIFAIIRNATPAMGLGLWYNPSQSDGTLFVVSCILCHDIRRREFLRLLRSASCAGMACDLANPR
jgi:hypothetical protein